MILLRINIFQIAIFQMINVLTSLHILKHYQSTRILNPAADCFTIILGIQFKYYATKFDILF